MSIEQIWREGKYPISINARDCNGVYPAEKILDRKKFGSQIKYLVKIKDYPEEAAVWETVENLYSVIHMVDEFDKSYQPKRRGRKPKNENKENFSEKKDLNKIDEIVNMESSYIETAPNSNISNSKKDETEELKKNLQNELDLDNHSKSIPEEKFQNHIKKTSTNEKRRKKTSLELLIESVPDLKLGHSQMPIKDLFKDPINDLINLTADKKIKVNNNSSGQIENHFNNIIESSFSSQDKKTKRKGRQRSNTEESSDTSEYVPQVESDLSESEEISLEETVTEENPDMDSNKSLKEEKKQKKEKIKQITEEFIEKQKTPDESKLVRCDISLILPKDTVVPITPTKNPGNINTDIPKKIVYAKNITGKGIYCMVDWKKTKEGKKPEPSYYPSDIIKKKYPELLLEYYQKRIESIKPRDEIKKEQNTDKFLKKRARKSVKN
jgi:hypothetical protein